MNSTLGYSLILLGLAFAAFAGVVGLWGGATRRDGLSVWVRRAIYGFSVCMWASNAVMISALLSHDFSVKYVAQVGSRATPLVFTVVSLWSALEGSILFWGAIMGAYLFAFAYLTRNEPHRLSIFPLGMMAIVATFFAFLIAGPANPWTFIPNAASDGPGPNPLLQNHPLMIIHPPMLYLGYVGMTVPFGIAAGALLRGEFSDAWVVPLRKWTLIPWTFLSVGIILGSWWAYAVLGWGGYWAWDPVENASFLPWLTSTAYIHSTMVLERRRSLKLWTLALGLASFVLTIVGTFMTRSGVFNSVHSFTQSDIGPTFLVFIALVFFFCIALLAVRGPLLVAESPLRSMVSREGSILLNNVVLVAITFTVFLGTIYPLVSEGLMHKRISVGEPYFNTMALPGGLLVLFLMGVGPVLPWGESSTRLVGRQLLIPTAAAVITPAICLALGMRGALPLGAFGLAAFATIVTLRELFLPAKARMSEQKESPLTALVRSASRARRRFGGYVVHLGIIAIIVAIAASSAYKVHSTGSVKIGDALEVGGHQIRLDGFSKGKEPHKEWIGADITIEYPNGSKSVRHEKLAPRMNYYERSNDPIGSPSVDEHLGYDVYVSLLAFNKEAGTASFNAWVFPLVGWIWYAIPFLVLGSLIAVWPSRKSGAPAPAASAAVAAKGPA